MQGKSVGIVAIVETPIALVVARGEDATLARIAVIGHHRRIEGGYLES
jgi:hypothetical protein